MNPDNTTIWMPVYIGDYLADTMHLSTEQHGAYLLLLFHLWRRGTLPDDDRILAKITGLNLNAWSSVRALLAEFFEISDGCWRHQRVERDRERAALRQDRAKTAAKARWTPQNAAVHDERADSEHTASIASGHKDALLDTCKPDPKPDLQTNSKSEPQAKDQSLTTRRKALLFDLPAHEARGPKTPDPRHTRFRSLLAEYWASKNPGSPEMPWQGRDAKALSELLSACPALTEEQFRQLLHNRARSAVAHGDRVYLWIANLTRFQEEIGIYNRPVSAGTGHAATAEVRRNSVVQAVNRALEIARGLADGAGETSPKPAAFLDRRVPAADGAGPRRYTVALSRDGDHRLAARDAADGPPGADGPLPNCTSVENAGGALRDRGLLGPDMCSDGSEALSSQNRRAPR